MSNVLAPEYLTVEEAAKLLRLNKATLYRAIERGELPALRLDPHGSIRIPAEALVVGGEARARGRTPATPGAVEPVAAARAEGGR